MPLTMRQFGRGLLVLAALGCLIIVGFFGFYWAASAGSSRGSPELAAEWRDHLAQFDSPEAATAADPDIIVYRFANGEWVFGRAANSHGIWHRGGGTIVVKDSSGQIRAFFGHVCGSGILGPGVSDLEQSPESWYERMTETSFQEHSFVAD